MRGGFVDLGRVGAIEHADVARKLHGRPLEPVADAEERDLMLARVFGGLHHAARAARAETARHEDAVRPLEQPEAAFLLERLGFDPLDVDAQAIGEAAVRRALR